MDPRHLGGQATDCKVTALWGTQTATPLLVSIRVHEARPKLAVFGIHEIRQGGCHRYFEQHKENTSILTSEPRITGFIRSRYSVSVVLKEKKENKDYCSNSVVLYDMMKDLLVYCQLNPLFAENMIFSISEPKKSN